MPTRRNSSFTDFLSWLATNCAGPRKTVTLGWNEYFYANFTGTSVRIQYGTKGNSEDLNTSEIERVWARFHELRYEWAHTGQYEIPSLVIPGKMHGPPFAAALVRDYMSST